MAKGYYTHAMWRVKPGNEEAFVQAWKALAAALTSLPHPGTQGTLIQSLTDPTLFYSFGPWDTLEDIAAMRSDPAAQEAIKRVRELCEEATPGAYRVVMEIHAQSKSHPDTSRV